MKSQALAPIAALLVSLSLAAAAWSEEYLTQAGNGSGIPPPTSTRTYDVTEGGRTIKVPEGMVYIPAGEFAAGVGPSARKVNPEGYCIAKFDVTNAEYREFLQANPTVRPPRYWKNGTYPEGKANHPVAFVSLVDATAYADWVGKKTGWKVVIPTGDQWEKAARGPQGYLYPWGNSPDVTYADGKLTARCNFNAVTAAQYLKADPQRTVTYNHPCSPYQGKQATVDHIAGIDAAGNATYLSIGQNGSVRGWVNHDTYTGFIYTDLFTALNDAGGNTSPVGAYESGKSGYGCYDMAGNLWNWCSTTITATNGAERGKTVNEIRGGSWYAVGTSCRSIATGEGRAASGAYNTVGFRIAMIPVP